MDPAHKANSDEPDVDAILVLHGVSLEGKWKLLALILLETLILIEDRFVVQGENPNISKTCRTAMVLKKDRTDAGR